MEFYWNSEVSRLQGEEKLTGVTARDVQTGEETEISLDGLFVSIGRAPAAALVEGKLQLDAGGYIVAGENTATGAAGVFAVGDVRTKELRQIVTAVADGAQAAHEAEKYLAENEHLW